jgi:hypothetical protein
MKKFIQQWSVLIVVIILVVNYSFVTRGMEGVILGSQAITTDLGIGFSISPYIGPVMFGYGVHRLAQENATTFNRGDTAVINQSREFAQELYRNRIVSFDLVIYMNDYFPIREPGFCTPEAAAMYRVSSYPGVPTGRWTIEPVEQPCYRSYGLGGWGGVPDRGSYPSMGAKYFGLQPGLTQFGQQSNIAVGNIGNTSGFQGPFGNLPECIGDVCRKQFQR